MSTSDNKLSECGHFTFKYFLNFLKTNVELCKKTLRPLR